jgi:hypothetical protein
MTPRTAEAQRLVDEANAWLEKLADSPRSVMAASDPHPPSTNRSLADDVEVADRLHRAVFIEVFGLGEGLIDHFDRSTVQEAVDPT